ncbi:glycosyltransferase family 4 protein [Agromyces sp. SYSU K20354]|uniref:glycosyltransferase family 4 protein n=1 Tax=Agromyces cavernae TaxID=2898659 RepID=UPI001E2B79A9|nr:glycosyltransferase family 4 protein [Agromyces cavernae]MCD2444069.1 glycosyltransferase family 4 protein [Agromyces cavernae]
MRVTIASRIYAPEPAAAAYRLAALANALAERGHQVTVLTTTVPDDAAPAPEHERIRIRRAPVIRDARGQVRGYVQYLSFDVPLFFRLVFGRRAEVIVTEPPPTTGFIVRLAAAIRRTPYVYYAADVWSDAAESTGAPAFIVRAVRRLERAALAGAARVIAVTDGVAERVRRLARRDRVTVVRNGVDTGIFTPDGARVDGPPTAVYAGTTSEWQGAEVFVHAMPRVRERVADARLVFIGQGSAWDDLRALAASVAPEAVDFVDLLPPDQAAARLRSARVGLVSLKPGLGYDFAVPTKLFAAAACGTPVLFAGEGASVAVVREGAIGTAVEYDVERVADALVAALSARPTPSDRTRISGWVRANASIAATGDRAAEVVEGAVR